MHTNEARKHGETDDRMHLLNAWREVPVFSERERAALAWAEAVTLVADSHVPDDVYEAGPQAVLRKGTGRSHAGDRRHQRLEPDLDRVRAPQPQVKTAKAPREADQPIRFSPLAYCCQRLT